MQRLRGNIAPSSDRSDAAVTISFPLTADASVKLHSERRIVEAGLSVRDDADVPRRDRQGVADVTTIECLRITFSITTYDIKLDLSLRCPEGVTWGSCPPPGI